jgi:hypothetical protein
MTALSAQHDVMGDDSESRKLGSRSLRPIPIGARIATIRTANLLLATWEQQAHRGTLPLPHFIELMQASQLEGRPLHEVLKDRYPGPIERRDLGIEM